MKEVMLLLAIGLAVGMPAAVGLGRLVSTQLYGIQPHDPWIAISTLLVLVGVSAAAGLIPAHRASRIDPILALRYEYRGTKRPQRLRGLEKKIHKPKA